MSYIENTQLKYADLFAKHGATLDGLAWPSGEGSHNFRTNKLLEVIDKKLNNQEKISILDVGCGYGYAVPYIINKVGAENLEYYGIDLMPEFINSAKETYKNQDNIKFEAIDLDSFAERGGSFDYIFCNGIFTGNHADSQLEWQKVFFKFVKNYFEKARIGMSFNIITPYCNFLDQNLFHFSPSDMMTYLLMNITHKVRIDHAYPTGFYEYACFLYHDDIIVNRKDLK